MKKLMFSAVAALAMTGFAAVESDNIVGYSTVTATKDSWMLTAVQFQAVDGTSAVLSDVVKGDFVGVDFDDEMLFMDTAPQMQIGDNLYFYINFEGETFWFDANAGGPDEGTTIDPGTALWFIQHGDDCSVTFAGQVLADASAKVDIAANTWTKLANPYPMAFAVSTDVTFTGLVGVDFDDEMAFMETAPQIQVPAIDALLFYINFEGSTFWFDANAGGPDEGTSVPVGSGLWIKAATDASATFTK